MSVYFILIHEQMATFFTAYYKSRLSVGESTTASFMSELLRLRDSYLYIFLAPFIWINWTLQL